MEIRDAFYAAAAHIEKHPQQFAFSENGEPHIACGTPGCILGWVGVFLGVKSEDIDPKRGLRTYVEVVAKKIGTNLSDFLWERLPPVEEPNFADDPLAAAKTMRSYADMYHAQQ